jgi:hypothetical protein
MESTTHKNRKIRVLALRDQGHSQLVWIYDSARIMAHIQKVPVTLYSCAMFRHLLLSGQGGNTMVPAIAFFTGAC